MSTTETITATELITTLEDQVLQLADHEAWLDAQIRELEFANSQISTSIPNENDLSPEEVRKGIEQRVDALKQELLTAVSLESVRTKVIDSAHGYQVVLKSLFKGEQGTDEKTIANAIEKRDEAVSQYLKIHRELRKVRHELSDTQIQVLDLQDENRKLVQLLANETTAMKEAAASRESHSHRRRSAKIEEDLKTVTIKHNVVSNVLQGLLLESDVDWANDPHYLELMLKLKRPSE